MNMYTTCKICDRGTLVATELRRLSGPAVAIGYIVLSPSILGIAVCAMLIIAFAIAGPALAGSDRLGHVRKVFRQDVSRRGEVKMKRLSILAVLLFCMGACAQQSGIPNPKWKDFEAQNGQVFQVNMNFIIKGFPPKGRIVYIGIKGANRTTDITDMDFDCEGDYVVRGDMDNLQLIPIAPRSVLAQIAETVCSVNVEPAQKIGTPTPPAPISSIPPAVERTFFVEPQYPPKAKLAHMSGTVVLRVTISKTGTVEKLQVDSSTNGLFNNSAMDAVKQWRFRPYLINNEPTEVNTTITVSFALNGGN